MDFSHSLDTDTQIHTKIFGTVNLELLCSMPDATKLLADDSVVPRFCKISTFN